MELFQKVFFETIWHDQTHKTVKLGMQQLLLLCARSLEAPANQKWIRGVEHIFLISDAPPEPRVHSQRISMHTLK